MRLKVVIIFVVFVMACLSSCRSCSKQTGTPVCYYEEVMCDDINGTPSWKISSHECKQLPSDKCQALASSEEVVKNFCHTDNFIVGDKIIQNVRFFNSGFCKSNESTATKSSSKKSEKGACFFNEKICHINEGLYEAEDFYHACMELTLDECQDLQSNCEDVCSVNAIDKDTFCKDDKTSNGESFKSDFLFIENISCPK